MKIHLLVWGNKRGQKVFFNSTPFGVESCIEDPTTYISIHEPKIKYYSLDSVMDNIVYTSYVSIFDWDIRARCVLAISVLIDKRYKIGLGKNILNLLDELTSKYLALYLDPITNSIKKINEDWSIFEEIVNKYQVELMAQPKILTLDQNASKYAVVKYNNETDIKDYLENPFREQYRGFKEIYFIPAGQQEIVPAPQLTDLTQIVPPREKSYKVELTISPTQLGAKLPNLENHIDFLVNQQRKEPNNTEVYKGDELSLLVNHPLCEITKNTFKVNDDSIIGDKVYIPLSVTLKPKSVKIQIKSERNLPIDTRGVKVILSDSSGKPTELKPNHMGQYEVEVAYGETRFYEVSAHDYIAENGSGSIDYNSDDKVVGLKSKVVPNIQPTITGGKSSVSNQEKYKPGEQVDLGSGSTITQNSELKNGKWKIFFSKLRIGKRGIFLILASIFIISLVFGLYYYIIIKPNKEKNKQISTLFQTVFEDSITISKLQSPYDSSTVERYMLKHDLIKGEINTFKVDSLNRIYENNVNRLLVLQGQILSQITINPVTTKGDTISTVADTQVKGTNKQAQPSFKSTKPKPDQKIKDQFITENAVMLMTNESDGKNRIDILENYLKNYDFGKEANTYKGFLNSFNHIYTTVKSCRKSSMNEEEIMACCKKLFLDENVNERHKKILENNINDFVGKVKNSNN